MHFLQLSPLSSWVIPCFASDPWEPKIRPVPVMFHFPWFYPFFGYTIHR